ncbi:MAG TPA: MFS transporter [Polyangiales bacterium]|nr:MFS transporter [Polyangiales bacterium]
MAALSRDFYLFLASRFASAVGLTMLRSAVLWHVYSISQSARDLGLIGIVQFIPALCLTLVGGAVADTYDRRRIINGAQLVLLLAGAFLFEATRRGAVNLPVLYGSVLLVSCAGAFESPARSAILPALVPREIFPRAVTISSTNQALAFASGPAVGGLIIAQFGIEAAYGSFIALMLVAFFSMLTLRFNAHNTGPKRNVSLAAIAEGVRFVWGRSVVLGCMTLDMFAVIFGGATALLPIYANDILHVGVKGYGLLSSTLEIGALAMALMLMLRPTVRRAGATLLITVAVYGLATIVFGLSRWFPLSVAAYMVAGMADQVSVVMRSTAIQLSTPDELRGRVSSVNMLFIGASNQLGAAESGFVASWTNPTFAVVSGGAACLLVVMMVAWRLPELRRYRIEPTRITA